MSCSHLDSFGICDSSIFNRVDSFNDVDDCNKKSNIKKLKVERCTILHKVLNNLSEVVERIEKLVLKQNIFLNKDGVSTSDIVVNMINTKIGCFRITISYNNAHHDNHLYLNLFKRVQGNQYFAYNDNAIVEDTNPVLKPISKEDFESSKENSRAVCVYFSFYSLEKASYIDFNDDVYLNLLP